TDNGDDEFHVRLISAVSETTSRVVLSGYASDVYDDLLTRAKGWSRIDRNVYAPTSSSTTAPRRTESRWFYFNTKGGRLPCPTAAPARSRLPPRATSAAHS